MERHDAPDSGLGATGFARESQFDANLQIALAEPVASELVRSMPPFQRSEGVCR
jgi:hypothetical protein